MCREALKRIFKLCDTNKDGILDASELNEFQRKCFDSPLQSQELSGIKETVLAHSPSGIRDNGLTESGFLYLHTMFIQRGRLETTWTVLRKFGYAEDLRLMEAFLCPKCVLSPSPSPSPSCGESTLIELVWVCLTTDSTSPRTVPSSSPRSAIISSPSSSRPSTKTKTAL